MHIATALTSLVVAASAVVATPVAGGWFGAGWGGNGNSGNGNGNGGWGGNGGGCGLTQANLNDLITGYTYLLVHPGGPDFNSTANRILTSDFSVYSDSINSLAGRPLGGPSFQPGRQAFIDSQNLTPPIPQLQTLDYFVSGNCSALKVGWRWLASGIGSNQYNVKGLIDMDLAAGPAGGDAIGIKTVYSEFNTAAWLRNYGVQCVTPPRQ